MRRRAIEYRLPLSIFGIWVLLFVEVNLAIVVTGLVFTLVGGMILLRVFGGFPWLPASPDAIAQASRDSMGRVLGNLRRLFFAIVFIPVFVGKVLAAGIHIAHLALSPSMDFWPGIVRIQGHSPSLNHTTLLAVLITLTPGTLTLDYDEKSDDLYVHWIDVTGYGDADMDERVVSGLRRWVRRLLG